MPMVSANFSMAAKKDFGIFAQSLTFIALTIFPWNGLKSTFRKKSERSMISSGFLRSGLSVPYLSIASANGIRTNGAGEIFLSVKRRKVSERTCSATAKTSS